jgi:hypothetical protein
VVEGMIPATPPQNIIQFQKPKRQILERKFENQVSSNIISNQEIKKPHSSDRTDQHMIFPLIRTAIDWNHLEESTVNTGNIEEFKTALSNHRN